MTHEQLTKILNGTEKIDNKEYETSANELTIFIGTWNMAGVSMDSNEKFTEWLYPVKNMKAPDIYVIGFQEIVELVFSNILFNSNANTVNNYRTLLTKNLQKIGE